LKLVENKLGQWVVLTDDNKVVIITTHKRIAERYFNEQGKLRSKRKR